MSFQILNYVYNINNFTANSYSLKEYKTIKITNNKVKCHEIEAIQDNPESKIFSRLSDSMSSVSSASSSLISDLTSSITSDSISSISSDSIPKVSLSKNVMVLQDDRKIIRSCDHFSGKIIETNEEIELIIDDPKKELLFSLKYDDIEITSYDLIEFTNKFGAKKLQRNFELNKLEKYVDKKNIGKYYNDNSALKIISKVREIFTEYLPQPNKIEFVDFLLAFDKNIKNDTDDIKNFLIKLRATAPSENISYVRWFEPNKSNKLIVFGDIHGSLSTFTRHLLRFKKMGVINENGKLKNDFYLIFLGDIVDRGIYSYEILMTLYLLIINNPKQIIFNNGNHEGMDVNGIVYPDIHKKNTIGSFINEMIEKFSDLKTCLKIYTGITNVMRIQPSAIICVDPYYKNKYIFMVHGCLPHDVKKNNNLDPKFIEDVKEKKSFYVGTLVKSSMRWNDFVGEENTLPSYRNSSKIKRIGKKVLNNAQEIGFEIIVRGHEDLHFNTKIIKDNTHKWISIKEESIKDQVDENNELMCKNEKDIFGNMTHIIKVDNNRLIINNNNTDYLPIITISTATDIGKNLTSDSYIIITFDNKTEKPNYIGGSPPQGGGKFIKYYVKNT